jgi:hypothetical protein
MSGLKENGMSNGEVLAAVNKNSKLNFQNPHKFPKVFRLLRKLLLHTFGFQGLS